VKARDNPFSTDRILGIRFAPLDGTWDDLLARLKLLRHRAAIVGPRGSGKTTLLEDLGERLERQGFRTHRLRLDAENRRLDAGVVKAMAKLGLRDMILFDGADHLGRLRWRWFKRNVRAGLIVTSHGKGLLPTLIECRTTPRLLADIARRLQAPEHLLEDDSVRNLFERHGGNIREALREMYDGVSLQR
jgi:hypothetical protein